MKSCRWKDRPEGVVMQHFIVYLFKLFCMSFSSSETYGMKNSNQTVWFSFNLEFIARLAMDEKSLNTKGSTHSVPY